jgi:hypothetical protein
MIIAIIIVLIRLLVPLTIFRWPFFGGIASMFGDAADVMIFEKFGYDGLYNVYHTFDKIFDMYYLFIEFLIVLTWANKLAKRTGITLFVWRFIGFVLFEITQVRAVLFFTPNIFEFFFLTWAGIMLFNPKFKLTTKRLVIILLLVGIPNIFKEYYMHYLAIPTWDILRNNVFWWLYK